MGKHKRFKCCECGDINANILLGDCTYPHKKGKICENCCDNGEYIYE